MKQLKFIPLHLTFSLIIGILTAFYFSHSLRFILIYLTVCLVLLTILYFNYRNKLKPSSLFTILNFALFFFIGMLTLYIHSDTIKRDHYLNVSIFKNESIVLKITKELKPGLFNYKFEANVLEIDNNSSQGKILLNIQKDSSFTDLKVDTKILVKATLRDVNAPKNPYQFNYKKYLEKKNIYKQLSITKSDYLLLNNDHTSLNGFAFKFREKVNLSLKKYQFEKEELSIINALLLGQRQEISKEVLENYTKAGAIHILAISGLHVGIILWLLSIILKPLEYFKNGKLIKLVLAVALLWCFAFIAGMSASVIRAVTMFTAVAISLLGKKQSNIYNNLVISIFILLLFNPFYLFDVGFQLSYLAVFFIVWLQPLLYKIWIPKLKPINFLWKIFTVSLAAQLGVLPLSLYYFHQFPGLFFVTNLVIIPFLGFILGFGLLAIFLSLANLLPQFLADLYQSIIGLMNQFIEWIALQESFLFQNISFSVLMLVSSYGLIIFSFRWIENKSPLRLKYGLLSLLLLQSVFIYEKWQMSSKNELIIFNKSRASVIGERNGNRLNLFHTIDSLKQHESFIKSYMIGSHAKELKVTDSINKSLLAAKNVLVIDSLGLYQFSNIESKTVLLSGSPKINLERLIKTIRPKKIIADNSNYKSYVSRWQKTSVQYKIPFYYTNKSGAYIIDQ